MKARQMRVLARALPTLIVVALVAFPVPAQTAAPIQSDAAGHPARELRLVGRLGPTDDPRVGPQSAPGIWAHRASDGREFAYIGTYFGNPGQGVKIVDVTDPSQPEVVSTIPDPCYDNHHTPVVRIDSAHFTGDVLVRSKQRPVCFVGPGGIPNPVGIDLFDVNDPSAPEYLGSYLTPGGGGSTGGGVHSVTLQRRGDKVFAFLAMFGEEGLDNIFIDSESEEAKLVDAELLIVDITDPRAPQIATSWTIGRDFGQYYGDCTEELDEPENAREPTCRGANGHVALHGLAVEGDRAYLAYWDAGLIVLDLSPLDAASDDTDVLRPELVQWAIEPQTCFEVDGGTLCSDEGNAVTAAPARDGGLTVVGDFITPFYEDDNPFAQSLVFATGDWAPPWGFIRVFDTSGSGDPVQLGAFATPNALTQEAAGPTDQYTAHEGLKVRGDTAYATWSRDGLVAIDFSDPTNPTQAVAFASDDSGIPGCPPIFVGVHLLGPRIYASDFCGGLWIFEDVTTAGSVTGAGSVPGENGTGTASFNLAVKSDGTTVTGGIRFEDLAGGVSIEAASFELLEVSTAVGCTITGRADVTRGDRTTPEDFTVTCEDSGEPGRADRLRIQTATYEGGGELLRGNLQVR